VELVVEFFMSWQRKHDLAAENPNPRQQSDNFIQTNISGI
jgi:hypothetical protein